MASISDSKTGMRNTGGIADLIVKGAIALVTAAIFIGAYLQFQVAFWLALIAALSVYITLLMLHTLMRRSERVDGLVSEVTRLESELANVKGRPGEYVPPTRGAQRSGLGATPANGASSAARRGEAALAARRRPHDAATRECCPALSAVSGALAAVAAAVEAICDEGVRASRRAGRCAVRFVAQPAAVAQHAVRWLRAHARLLVVPARASAGRRAAAR